MAPECFEDSAQRRVQLGDGIGFSGDCPVDGGGELRHKFIHKRKEDGLFVEEVEVEAALRAIRRADDVIHNSSVIALLGKDLLCRVEQALTGSVLIAGGVLASRA